MEILVQVWTEVGPTVIYAGVILAAFLAIAVGLMFVLSVFAVVMKFCKWLDKVAAC